MMSTVRMRQIQFYDELSNALIKRQHLFKVTQLQSAMTRNQIQKHIKKFKHPEYFKGSEKMPHAQAVLAVGRRWCSPLCQKKTRPKRAGFLLYVLIQSVDYQVSCSIPIRADALSALANPDLVLGPV